MSKAILTPVALRSIIGFHDHGWDWVPPVVVFGLVWVWLPFHQLFDINSPNLLRWYRQRPVSCTVLQALMWAQLIIVVRQYELLLGLICAWYLIQGVPFKKLIMWYVVFGHGGGSLWLELLGAFQSHSICRPSHVAGELGGQIVVWHCVHLVAGKVALFGNLFAALLVEAIVEKQDQQLLRIHGD